MTAFKILLGHNLRRLRLASRFYVVFLLVGGAGRHFHMAAQY